MGVHFEHDKTSGMDSRRLRAAFKNAKFIEDDDRTTVVKDCSVLLHGQSYTIILTFTHDGVTYSFPIDRQWFKKAKRDFETFSTILRTAGVVQAKALAAKTAA